MRFFIIVILSGIFCLFSSQVAQSAEINIVDNNVFVDTDAYEVQFTDGVITHLSNKLTGETYTLPIVSGVPVGISGRSGLLRRDGGQVWTDRATLTAAPSLMDINPTTSDTEEIIVVQRALRELEAVSEKTPNVKITIQFLRLYLENANRNVTATKLLPNYPNPFNPETWIPYQLAEAADVSVKIYDVSGRLVRTISVGFTPIGYYLTRERAVYWDGQNETGEAVSGGVYFLQFVAGDFTTTQRMVIVK